MNEIDPSLKERLAGRRFTREDLIRDTIIGRTGMGSLIEQPGFTREDLLRDTTIGRQLPEGLPRVSGYPIAPKATTEPVRDLL